MRRTDPPPVAPGSALPTDRDPAAAGISRRTLLAAGSTCAVGAFALGPARAARVAAPPAFEVISVGFVEGSERLANLRPLPWPLLPGERPQGAAPLEVVPAGKLLMGDPDLALGRVDMTVHGLHPGLGYGGEAAFDTASFIVYFPSEDPAIASFFPFIAWGARGGSRPTTGAPLTVPVHLRVDGGLDLVLEVAAPAAPAFRPAAGRPKPPIRPGPTLRATSFTVDPVPGLPKLQRGIYLLGLGDAVWDGGGWLGETSEIARTSLVVSFEPRDEIF